MKWSFGFLSAAALGVAAGRADARNYVGSDTLENFTKTLASACGSFNPTKYNALAAGEFNFLGGGSAAGGTAMRNGTQDISPQTRTLTQAEACETVIETGPEGEPALTISAGSQQQHWAIARDGIAIFTSEANALRCDVAANNPNPGITHADNGTPGADLDDVRADEDDFGASLAFNNGAVINCGSFTPAIPLASPSANASLGFAASSTSAGLGIDYTASIGSVTAPVSANVGNTPPASGTQQANANLPGFAPGINGTAAGVITTTFTAGSCNYPNPVVTPDTASTYTFTDWRDVLRVLWAGADHNRFPGNGSGQTAANRQDRCGSPIRQGLISNWDNIVQHLPGGCGATAGSCQNPTTGVGLPLRHIFRRDDGAATADVFLSLLGVAASGGSITGGDLGVNQPFCNGKDTQDLDPIRVRCTQASTDTGENDETCGVDQTTGLVLPIRVPSLVGTTNTTPNTVGNRRPALKADLYPTQNCTVGAFQTRKPPAIFNDVLRCPDKTPFLFTGCLTPVLESAPGVASNTDCNCINPWTNHTAAGKDENAQIGGLQNDGRVWNNIVRGDRTGGKFGNPAIQCPVLRDERGDEILLSHTRMRYRTQTVLANAVPTDHVCAATDAAKTMGCLSRVSDCSLGFDGRTAIVTVDGSGGPPVIEAYTGATALLVGPATGTAPFGPSKTQIFAGVQNVSGYQFARKVYINSVVGVNALFDASHPAFAAVGGEPINPNGTRSATAPVGVGPEQAQLMECLLSEDPNVVTSPLHKALEASGFLPLRTATDARPSLDTAVNRACP